MRLAILSLTDVIGFDESELVPSRVWILETCLNFTRIEVFPELVAKLVLDLHH